jgi:hypothetical protein
MQQMDKAEPEICSLHKIAKSTGKACAFLNIHFLQDIKILQ